MEKKSNFREIDQFIINGESGKVILKEKKKGLFVVDIPPTYSFHITQE